MLPLPDFLIVQSKKERKNEWGLIFGGTITIRITYDSLMKSIEQGTILQELLHQMVHIYCYIYEIKDTTRQGRYHNENFRKVAKDYGLIVQPDLKFGAIVTGCQEQVRELQQSQLPEFESDVQKVKKLIQDSDGQAHAYICPACKRKVTGDKDTKVICGYCYMEMIAFREREA